jgi:hypothetical protein
VIVYSRNDCHRTEHTTNSFIALHCSHISALRSTKPERVEAFSFSEARSLTDRSGMVTGLVAKEPETVLLPRTPRAPNTGEENRLPHPCIVTDVGHSRKKLSPDW